MLIHKNENYNVIVDGGKYKVQNAKTGVTEFEGDKLPEAIGAAEHSNTFLVYKMWEWIGTQGKIQREQYDKEFAAQDFSLDDDDDEVDTNNVPPH